MNPLIDTSYYVAFISALVLYMVVVFVMVSNRRKREISTVRSAILEYLKLPEGEDSWERALEEILVLTPAKIELAEGAMEVLGRGPRLWICFQKNGFAVVSVNSGQVLEFGTKDFGRMYLFDVAGTIGFLTEDGSLQFRFEYLDDMMRVVNVMIAHRVQLGYVGT